MADNPPLITEVSADTAPFKAGMKDVVDTASVSSKAILDELKKMERGFETVKDAVTSVEGALKLVGQLAIGGGIAVGVFKGISDTLTQLTRIQEGADAIGVTTDAFQELTFAMGRAGVVQADQDEALRKFAETAGEASAGFGDLHEALEKYDQGALDALEDSDSLRGQLDAVANAVKGAAGEQERAAIITAAFGKNTEELRRFLSGGASAIEDAAQKARDFGVIIDEDLVRKAPEIKDKFETAAAVIGVTLQNAFLAAAPVVIDFTGQLADLVQNVVVPAIEKFGELAGSINVLFASANLGENSLSTLKAQLRDVNSEIGRAAQTVETGFGSTRFGFSESEEAAMARLFELQQRAAQIQDEIDRRGWQGSLETQRGKAKQPGPSESAIGRAQNDLLKIEEDYLKATQQTTAVIELEHQKRLASLQKSLDDGLISYGDFVKAEAELEATATAKISMEAVKRIQPLTNVISNDLSRAFDELFRTGNLNADEFFRSMLADIAKVSFQMAVLQPLFGGGSTPGGGFVGNLLAGVFHDGTSNARPGGRSRAVPAHVFASAPRFHNGFAPKEFPAILEEGEGVISRRGMAQLASGAGGGNNTVVQIYNQSGGEVREERSRQGNTDIVRIMIGAVKEDMGRGGFDGVMRGAFGVTRQTGQR